MECSTSMGRRMGGPLFWETVFSQQLSALLRLLSRRNLGRVIQARAGSQMRHLLLERLGTRRLHRPRLKHQLSHRAKMLENQPLCDQSNLRTSQSLKGGKTASL